MEFVKCPLQRRTEVS